MKFNKLFMDYINLIYWSQSWKEFHGDESRLLDYFSFRHNSSQIGSAFNLENFLQGTSAQNPPLEKEKKKPGHCETLINSETRWLTFETCFFFSPL